MDLFHQHPLDDALDEIELIGFSVCDVFELVDADLSRYLPAKALHVNHNKEVTVIGFLITSKPVHTIKQEMMFFHKFIDPAGDWPDTVFFPQAARYQNVSRRGFYEMMGKVIEGFGVYNLDVHSCKKVGIKETD